MNMEVTYTIPEMTEEDRALHSVQRGLEALLPEYKGIGTPPIVSLLREVRRYGDTIRNAERRLADVRSNGT